MTNDEPILVGGKGAQPELLRSLAKKWGPIFGCPERVIVVISKIESSWDPGVGNVNARAMLVGGAYGFMGMGLSTAKGHVAALKAMNNPTVSATLARFDGTAKTLLIPDVNVMFGAYQLGKAAKEFGADRLDLIATAYHQGRGMALRVMDADDVAAELGARGAPKGQAYVTRALDTERRLYG